MRELDEANKVRHKIGLIVADKYRIEHKVATGSYGQIYAAAHLNDSTPVSGKTHRFLRLFFVAQLDLLFAGRR